VAFYGMDRVRFANPTFIGDTIHVETEVVEKDVKDEMTGVLTVKQEVVKQDGSIDTERCRQIIELANGRETVFHRAFDVAPDPMKALEQLIELGFTRVLTSGQQRSVPDGIGLIKKLIAQAGDRIEILPGGGIRLYNVRAIVEQTGAKQVHLSAFGQKLDKSTHHRPHITFGGALHPPEDRYDLIDSSIIQSISDLLTR